MENETTHKDKHFKGQQDGEAFVCFFRRHWITLLKEFIYFTIFIFIILYSIIHIQYLQETLRGNRELKLFFMTGFALATVYFHRFFIKMLNYFVNIGIITDMRIIDHQKSIFFQDSLDSIELAQIQNIEKVQEGILPSILGFGDIKIFLNASDSVKTFRTIPNARFHFRCLNRQKEIRQRAINRHDRGDYMLQQQPPLQVANPAVRAVVDEMNLKIQENKGNEAPFEIIK